MDVITIKICVCVSVRSRVCNIKFICERVIDDYILESSSQFMRDFGPNAHTQFVSFDIILVAHNHLKRMRAVHFARNDAVAQICRPHNRQR